METEYTPDVTVLSYGRRRFIHLNTLRARAFESVFQFCEGSWVGGYVIYDDMHKQLRTLRRAKLAIHHRHETYHA